MGWRRNVCRNGGRERDREKETGDRIVSSNTHAKGSRSSDRIKTVEERKQGRTTGCCVGMMIGSGRRRARRKKRESCVSIASTSTRENDGLWRIRADVMVVLLLSPTLNEGGWKRKDQSNIRRRRD